MSCLRLDTHTHIESSHIHVRNSAFACILNVVIDMLITESALDVDRLGMKLGLVARAPATSEDQGHSIVSNHVSLSHVRLSRFPIAKRQDTNGERAQTLICRYDCAMSNIRKPHSHPSAAHKQLFAFSECHSKRNYQQFVRTGTGMYIRFLSLLFCDDLIPRSKKAAAAPTLSAIRIGTRPNDTNRRIL